MGSDAALSRVGSAGALAQAEGRPLGGAQVGPAAAVGAVRPSRSRIAPARPARRRPVGRGAGVLGAGGVSQGRAEPPALAHRSGAALEAMTARGRAGRGGHPVAVGAVALGVELVEDGGGELEVLQVVLEEGVQAGPLHLDRDVLAPQHRPVHLGAGAGAGAGASSCGPHRTSPRPSLPHSAWRYPPRHPRNAASSAHVSHCLHRPYSLSPFVSRRSLARH